MCDFGLWLSFYRLDTMYKNVLLAAESLRNRSPSSSVHLPAKTSSSVASTPRSSVSPSIQSRRTAASQSVTSAYSFPFPSSIIDHDDAEKEEEEKERNQELHEYILKYLPSNNSSFFEGNNDIGPGWKPVNTYQPQDKINASQFSILRGQQDDTIVKDHTDRIYPMKVSDSFERRKRIIGSSEGSRGDVRSRSGSPNDHRITRTTAGHWSLQHEMASQTSDSLLHNRKSRQTGSRQQRSVNSLENSSDIVTSETTSQQSSVFER
jgi:hypothetical protein